MRTVEGREGLSCQWQQVDCLRQLRKRIVKWWFNIRNKPSGIEKLWLFSDSSSKRTRWQQGARFKSNKKHWLFIWGKMKISIPLDFTNTESFVWVQGQRRWVQGSITTPWLVGTSVPPQASRCRLEVCRDGWFIFIHGPACLYAQNKILLLFAPITLKRSMQQRVTYDSALICVWTLLFARERQK